MFSVLVVHDDDVVGKAISEAIFRSCPEGDAACVTLAGSSFDALKMTQQTEVPYNWVVATEFIGRSTGHTAIERTDKPSGIAFLNDWMSDHHQSGRGILVLEKELSCSNTELHKNIVPLLRSDLDDPILSEVLSAGKIGVSFVPPTTLTIYLDERRGEANGGSSTCSAAFGWISKGLFHTDLELLMQRSEALYPDVLGNFNELAACFRKAATAPIRARRQELNKAAQSLQSVLMDRLSGFVHRSRGVWKHWDTDKKRLVQLHPNDLSVTPAVHLQIRCKSSMLAIPFDLVHVGDNTAYAGQLCVKLPVTWRIAQSPNRDQYYDDLDENRTEYNQHRVFYSCRKDVRHEGLSYKGLSHVEREAHEVNPDGAPTPITRKVHLTRRFHASSSGSRHMVHATSHGGHNPDTPDEAFILVGPTNGSTSGEHITAFDLEPEDGEWPPRFFYANCCMLAHQDAESESNGSYFGGFVDGVLAGGVSPEVVANRWNVLDSVAAETAVEFYRWRPRIASARAAALHRARIKAYRKAYTDGAPAALCIATLLAPIHVLVAPAKNGLS